MPDFIRGDALREIRHPFAFVLSDAGKIGRLCVLVDDAGFRFAAFQIDHADKQGNLVVRIQIIPQQRGQRVELIRDFHALGFTLKAGQRISVMHVGVDEMAFARQRIFVCEGVAVAGLRIAVAAF